MIRIIAVGKIKESWMKMGISEYLKRLIAYEKIEIVEVEDEKTLETNSQQQNEIVKNKEGQRLL